jgi:GNAT superfamily N-acetyltransferase
MSETGPSETQWKPRPAAGADFPAIEALIPLSVRELQAPYYSAAQMDAALGPVFGVDSQLVRDGTYYVVERGRQVVGCGGWSKRSSLFGGDQGRELEDPELDPRVDPARLRAFFVHPAWARRGIGRSLMAACEQAISGRGFAAVVAVSTLAGEPLYAAHGYGVTERYDIPLKGGLRLPVVRMRKSLSGAVQAP